MFEDYRFRFLGVLNVEQLGVRDIGKEPIQESLSISLTLSLHDWPLAVVPVYPGALFEPVHNVVSLGHFALALL